MYLTRQCLRASRFLQLRQKSTDAIARTSNSDTITRQPGPAFEGDLRSESGVGLGDGIENHTGKWMTVRPTLPAASASRGRSRLADAR